MKEYTLKFGMHYKINTWHVIHTLQDNRLISSCTSNIYMGSSNRIKEDAYIYPIANEHYGKYYSYGLKTDYNLSFNRICPKCKKKFQLTKEDINHYIVLAKFGIKI